jgi:hypothetical protein
MNAVGLASSQRVVVGTSTLHLHNPIGGYPEEVSELVDGVIPNLCLRVGPLKNWPALADDFRTSLLNPVVLN